MNTTKKKVNQIAIMPGTEGDGPLIFALRNDGEIFVRNANLRCSSWEKLPPVPQS